MLEGMPPWSFATTRYSKQSRPASDGADDAEMEFRDDDFRHSGESPKLLVIRLYVTDRISVVSTPSTFASTFACCAIIGLSHVIKPKDVDTVSVLRYVDRRLLNRASC